MNHLRQMSLFAYVVEAGSISGAAEKLNLSKSVVSQHLKALEKELGTVLIKRTTRRQILTNIGEQFYFDCQKINAIANSAWDSALLSQAEPQGRIRITAPHALMDVLISPIMAELMLKYPKLKPELISDDQYVNLIDRDIDLAIRVGFSEDSSLKQKRIGVFRDVLCGATYIQDNNIEQQPYIANQWQGKMIKHRFKSNQGEVYQLQKQASCLTNSLHSCISLISAGAGIGIIPDFYFKQFKGKLKRLLPSMNLPENPVFALTPFYENPPPAVILCIEAINNQLKGDAEM